MSVKSLKKICLIANQGQLVYYYLHILEKFVSFYLLNIVSVFGCLHQKLQKTVKQLHTHYSIKGNLHVKRPDLLHPVSFSRICLSGDVGPYRR